MVEDILQIDTIPLTSFRNVAHLQVMVDTQARVNEFNNPDPATTENRLPPKALAQYHVLLGKIQVEDEAYKATLEDDRSAQMKTLDTDRDRMQDTLRQTVNMYLKASWDTERQEAAEALDPVLRKYDVNTQLNYLEEGQTILQQNQELLGSARLTKALNKLGLKELVESLSEKSQQLNELLRNRNSDHAAQLTAALKAARHETDEAYRLLVKLVNAYALVDEDEERFNPLILGLNADIKYYRQYMLKALPDGKKDAPAPEPDDTTEEQEEDKAE